MSTASLGETLLSELMAEHEKMLAEATRKLIKETEKRFTKSCRGGCVIPTGTVWHTCTRPGK